MSKLNFDDCWYKEVCTNECSSTCIRFLEMSYLMEHSGVPKKRQKPVSLTPSDDDYDTFVRLNKIRHNIVDFVEDGRSIYIYSENTGNGKTSWALKLMFKYFDEIWAGNGFRTRGLFIYVPTFISKLKDFNTVDAEFEEMKRAIATADLVVWDDIGSSVLSNYDLTQLCNYLEQRIGEKANIFTGNLGQDDLKSTFGDRLYSRIWNMSDRFEFKGKDRRSF